MVIVSACNKMGDKLTESPSRAVTNFGSSITRTRPLTSKHPVITREHLGLLVIESVASGLTHLFIPSSDQTTSPALHMALVDMQACVHQTLSHPDLGEWHAWYASETRLGDANVKSLVSPIMERIMQMQAEQSFVKRTAVPGVRGRARTRNRASGH